jgi:serpin B
MKERSVSILGIVAAFILAAAAAGTGGKAAAGKKAGKAEATAAVAASNNDFAFDLYGRLAKEKGNLFFSPASLSTALAMTYAGAGGATAGEMKKTLRFTLEGKGLHAGFGMLVKALVTKKKGCSLFVANALWGQKGYKFLSGFLKLVKKSYGAGLQAVDFKGATEEARKTINDWTEKNTNQKIKDLLKPGVLTGETRLVLTNAIYFKGMWKAPFDKANTVSENFRTLEGETIAADMMHMRGKKFNYMKGEGFSVLEMPYAAGDVSMVIFLPDKVDGLAEYEKMADRKNMKELIAGMEKTEMEDVAIPRFTVTREFSLASVLGAMGMPTAFTQAADFSGIDGTKDLYISAVIHKAFVEVNEEGTQAAAATAVVVGLKGMSMNPSFRADHPFMFVILHRKTGALLFIGRVADPTAA